MCFDAISVEDALLQRDTRVLIGMREFSDTTASIVGHFVRQLIHIIRAAWKVTRKEFAGFLDAVNNSAGELGFREVAGHLRRQLLPETFAAAGVDPHITDHRK